MAWRPGTHSFLVASCEYLSSEALRAIATLKKLCLEGTFQMTDVTVFSILASGSHITPTLPL